MAKITDDADHYYIEFEEDRFIWLTVSIKKPCPLREIEQRAVKLISSFNEQYKISKSEEIKEGEKTILPP